MTLASRHAWNGCIEVFVVNKERVDEITGCNDTFADHASNGGGFAIAARAGSLVFLCCNSYK